MFQSLEGSGLREPLQCVWAATGYNIYYGTLLYNLGLWRTGKSTELPASFGSTIIGFSLDTSRSCSLKLL